MPDISLGQGEGPSRMSRTGGMSGSKGHHAKIHHAPTFKDFADDTTIHGIKDAVSSRNVFSRVVWTLLVCCSTMAAAFGIYQTVRGYLDRPKATQVKQLIRDTYPYPSILFCPHYWINASRAMQLNLTKDDLSYALSFMPMIRLRNSIANKNETALKFDRMMKEQKFPHLFDFYTLIAYDSEQILTCNDCETWPANKKMVEKGVCYELNYKDARRYNLDDFLRPPYFQYNNPMGMADDSWLLPQYTLYTSSDRLYIGMGQNDYFSSNAEKLKQNSSYLVTIVPAQQKRLSHGRVSCMSEGEYHKRNISLQMCYADCEQRVYGPACWGFVHAGYFYGASGRIRGRKGNGTVPLWSSFTHDTIDPSSWTDCEAKHRRKYEKCAQHCLPRCDEWVYKVTVVEVYTRRLLAHTTESTTTVVFNYQLRSSALLYEERATYTWDTFLSDVGGQMGLWLGASILSVCQLVFFLFRWVEYRLQVRAAEAIEHSRRTSGGIVTSPQ